MFHGQVHSSPFVATFGIELDGLINFALLLEILCTLDLDLLRGLKRHHHDLLVKVRLLREADSMVQTTRPTVEHDCLTDIVYRLVVARKIETSLRIV